MNGWTNFFIATAGAAAAISGTLLVAMSINIVRIVGQPTLPGRAANTLIIVATALLTSAIALAPLTLQVLGWTVVILGTALLISAGHVVRIVTAHRSEDLNAAKVILGIAGPVLAPLPYLAGGLLLTAQDPLGFGLIAIAVLISLSVALQNSWVLLVEILR